MVSIYRMLCGLCYYGNYYTCVNLVTTALGRRSDPSNTFVSYWYAALMEIPIWILPFILQGRLRVCQVALTVSLLCAAVSSIWYAILPTGELWGVLLKQSLFTHPVHYTFFISWYSIFLNQWVIQLFKTFHCILILSALPPSSTFLSHLICLPNCHTSLPSILSFYMPLKIYVNATQNISLQEKNNEKYYYSNVISVWGLCLLRVQ
jgi:hypothetical protein